MMMHPFESGAVRFESFLLATKPRMVRQRMHAVEGLRMCSWCKRGNRERVGSIPSSRSKPARAVRSERRIPRSRTGSAPDAQRCCPCLRRVEQDVGYGPRLHFKYIRTAFTVSGAGDTPGVTTRPDVSNRRKFE